MSFLDHGILCSTSPALSRQHGLLYLNSSTRKSGWRGIEGFNKEQDFRLVANTVKSQSNEWLRDKIDDKNPSQQDIEFGAALNL